jgi:hypothetical protein
MTKYTVTMRRQEERRWNVHPIWRGIGCIMILLIIVMAYALAKEFVDYNERTSKLALPKEIYRPVNISQLKYVPALNEGGTVNKFLAHIKYGYVIFTLIFMFLGLSAFSFIYSAIYRFSGPPRYTPLDSPPVGKPRKRR